MKRLLSCLALAAGLTAASPVALAHQVSHAFLSLTESADDADRRDLQVQWDIPLRDLDMVLDLDADRDGALTHGEIRARASALADLAGGGLSVLAGERDCAPDAPVQSLYRHADGVHARLAFLVRCPASAEPLTLLYTLFADFDASHRVIVEQDGRTHLIQTGQRLALADPRQAGEPDTLVSRLGGFVRSGIHHILIGWDHLAFLLALLIASTRAPTRPSARLTASGPHARRRAIIADLREVFWSVTAFTLAHPVTLSGRRWATSACRPARSRRRSRPASCWPPRPTCCNGGCSMRRCWPLPSG
ncbi:MAG: HupE/UreJ family protein [Burkholderiaceae bacterium]